MNAKLDEFRCDGIWPHPMLFHDGDNILLALVIPGGVKSHQISITGLQLRLSTIDSSIEKCLGSVGIPEFTTSHKRRTISVTIWLDLTFENELLGYDDDDVGCRFLHTSNPASMWLLKSSRAFAGAPLRLNAVSMEFTRYVFGRSTLSK